jgi:hypothetical protein
VVVASVFMLFTGALVAAGTGVWYLAVPRGQSDHLIYRVMYAGLAVGMIGVAGKKIFWDATRTRRPRWQRALAVLALLGAVYVVVVAIRGA